MEDSSRFLNNLFVKEFNEYIKKPEISIYSHSEINEDLYKDRENLMEEIKYKAKSIVEGLRLSNDIDLENLVAEIDFSKPM